MYNNQRKENRRNNYNYNNYNNSRSSYNNNVRDNNYNNRNNNNRNKNAEEKELVRQIWEKGVIEAVGLQRLYEMCMKSLKGEQQLPWYINFDDCYRAFWRWERIHGPPFQCRYQHSPLTCLGCLRNCTPSGKCKMDGLED